jgi:SOUL heme-binding protein
MLTETPKMKVAVASYGGWADDKNIVQHAAALGQALTHDGVKFVNTTYTTAGYDSPFRLFERHNEIWMRLL